MCLQTLRPYEGLQQQENRRSRYRESAPRRGVVQSVLSEAPQIGNTLLRWQSPSPGSAQELENLWQD